MPAEFRPKNQKQAPRWADLCEEEDLNGSADKMDLDEEAKQELASAKKPATACVTQAATAKPTTNDMKKAATARTRGAATGPDKTPNTGRRKPSARGRAMRIQAHLRHNAANIQMGVAHIKLNTVDSTTAKSMTGLQYPLTKLQRGIDACVSPLKRIRDSSNMPDLSRRIRQRIVNRRRKRTEPMSTLNTVHKYKALRRKAPKAKQKWIPKEPEQEQVAVNVISANDTDDTDTEDEFNQNMSPPSYNTRSKKTAALIRQTGGRKPVKKKVKR